MKKRTLQLLIGGFATTVILVLLFSFLKNRTDWRSSDYPGSGTNWISFGKTWNNLN